jgi:hypothetical protein
MNNALLSAHFLFADYSSRKGEFGIVSAMAIW